jgi:hypothetical protein
VGRGTVDEAKQCGLEALKASSHVIDSKSKALAG